MPSIAKSLVASLALATGLFAAYSANAAPVTCTATNNPAATTPQLPGCVVVPGGTATTGPWVIPAQGVIPGENEPNGEQVMTLFFRAASQFISTHGTQFSILGDGTSSDLVTITTAGFTGITPAGGVLLQFT